MYLKGCALPEPGLTEYETPLGNLPLDLESSLGSLVLAQLRANPVQKFLSMDKDVQEDEHSLEMHLPFARLIGASDCSIVPIMVGEVNEASAASYAQVLDPYFRNNDTVFLVSSDFCHWGSRFDYTWYKPEDGKIHQSIAKLDQAGMAQIENQSYRYGPADPAASRRT